MSDLGASTGGVELGAVEIDFIGNTAPVEAQAQSLMTRLQGMGNAITGGAQSGFLAFGTAASGAITGVMSKVSMLSMAMGPTSPMASMIMPINAIAGGFQHIAEQEEIAESQGRKFVGITPLLQGVGFALLGAGAAATALGAPLQNATAAFDTAVTNTGKNVSDYTGQLNTAVNAGKQFGFNAADITQALSQLTAETRNPDEAFKELTMTETLAAATHNTLGAAARQMGQIHAGMYRSLRQFGIQLPQIKNDTANLAAEEQKLADAGTKVTEAHDKLAAYQTELNDKMAADQEKYTQAVESDQNRLEIAEQNLADLKQKVQVDDVQRAQDLAAAVEDSAQKQMDAEQNLADLKQKLSAQGSQAIEDQMSMADAQARLDAAKLSVATTAGPAQQAAILQERSAQEALTKEKLRQKDQAVANAKALASAQSQVSSSTLTHTKAVQAQTDFVQVQKQHQLDLVKAQDSVHTSNLKLVDDQAKLAASMQPTVAQAEKLKSMNEAVTAATEKQTTLQQKVSDIKNQQARLDAGFAAAEQQFMEREQGLLQRRADTWAGHVAKFKAYIQDMLQESGKLAPALFLIGGLTSAAGTLGAIGKTLGKITTGIGQKLGSKLLTKGTGVGEAKIGGVLSEEALSGIDLSAFGGKEAAEAEKAEGRIKSAFSAIAGHFGILKKSTEGITQFSTIGKDVEGMGAAMTAAAPEMDAAGAEIGGAGLAAEAPWAPIVLAIGAVVAIGYVIYRNWGTISKGLAAAWNFIFEIGKKVFGALEGVFKKPFEFMMGIITGTISFVKSHWVLILAILTGPLGLAALFISKHLNDIVGFFKALPGNILKVLGDVGSWLLHIGEKILGGLWTGLMDYMKILKAFWIDLPKTVIKWLLGVLGGPIKWLEDVGKQMIEGITKGISGGGGKVARAIKKTIVDAPKNLVKSALSIFSPSQVYHGFGMNISLGMANGIEAGAHHVQDRMAAMTRNLQTPTFTTAPYRPPTQLLGYETGGGRPAGAGDFTPTGGKILNFENHFHTDVSPLHVANELAWNANL